MYTRITRNMINREYDKNTNVFTFSYCEIQYILSTLNVKKSGYNCGLYGWNYDVYELEYKGIKICLVTGYRPYNARRLNYKIVAKYDSKCLEYAMERDYKRAKATANSFIRILYKEVIKKYYK